MSNGERMDYDIMAVKLHTLESSLRILREITALQCTDGNWDANDYMRGMANGMILAVATMEDKEPEYKDKPA